MEISDLITPARVIPAFKVTSKKQALQELSRACSEFTGLDERAIFEVLVERERLGTTGVGRARTVVSRRVVDQRLEGFNSHTRGAVGRRGRHG